ncbi:hypothetical protein K461DRAFT_69338 [Myriangium duriaei CBS 260.36]|uniref:Amino acid permease/ SLC12A domain-containing protein n=1 Tax=Myriangium duriaei CBS 260.36 TaxID=1168546 RepID=A0A9P4ITP5_9PEZI|nr:hypothetical protein K461DRAFT_69338 [Myriangium duriaei CBS 260.36]
MCPYRAMVIVATHWVDDSFGFALGWKLFFYEAVFIPFEASALDLVITFWSDKVPLVAVCVGCIVLYGWTMKINATLISAVEHILDITSL